MTGYLTRSLSHTGGHAGVTAEGKIRCSSQNISTVNFHGSSFEPPEVGPNATKEPVIHATTSG
jgi:hypothetical protein